MIAPKPVNEAEEAAERAADDEIFDAIAEATLANVAAEKTNKAADAAAPVKLSGKSVPLADKTKIIVPKSIEETVAARQAKRRLTHAEHLEKQGENRFVSPAGFNVFQSEHFFVQYEGPGEYRLTFDWLTVLDKMSGADDGWRFLPYRLGDVFNALNLSHEAEYSLFAMAMIPHMLTYTSGLWLLMDGANDHEIARSSTVTDHNRWRYVTLTSYSYVVAMQVMWQQISAPGDPRIDTHGHVIEMKTNADITKAFREYQAYRDLVDEVEKEMNRDHLMSWVEHCQAYKANKDVKWLYAWGISWIRIKERAILRLCNVNPDMWDVLMTPKCIPAEEHCAKSEIDRVYLNVEGMCRSAMTHCLKEQDGDKMFWFIAEHHTPDVLEKIKTPQEYATTIVGDIFGIPEETYQTWEKLGRTAKDIEEDAKSRGKPAAQPAPRQLPKGSKPLTNSQKRKLAKAQATMRAAQEMLNVYPDQHAEPEPSQLSPEQKATLIAERKREASEKIAAAAAAEPAPATE
jgi:hypothetical protein